MGDNFVRAVLGGTPMTGLSQGDTRVAVSRYWNGVWHTSCILSLCLPVGAVG